MRNQSQRLLEAALRRIPGGVNSPVRAFRAVGGSPFFVERAKGSRIWDVDGRERIDFVGTWGPAILGHAPDCIVAAVRRVAAKGVSFGIPNPLEVEMAEWICGNVPSVEKVRMCNSGTEATMSAVRLARGFTQRDKIIKFEGCYHGHVDSLLVKAGSGALSFGHPDSAGVPRSFAEHTIVLPFNRFEAVDAAFVANSGQIAGVILEPVPANAGLYLPSPGFLEYLRETTAKHESLLIFDEVMTGFRLGFGGAQERYGVRPDLSCFGKVIGGGFPVGAFGGRAAIMDCLAPDGSVYQAGTLSGNPIAMAAGIAALRTLRDGALYDLLDGRGRHLEEGLRQAAGKAGQAVQVQRAGSMFCVCFTERSISNLDDVMTSDRRKFAKFFHGMLAKGVYLAPSPFETGFLSTAHSEQDVQQTIDAAAEVMKTL